MNRHYLYSAIIALIISITSIGAYTIIDKKGNTVTIEHINSTPVSSTAFSHSEGNRIIPIDFTETAEKVIDAVVHIKSTHLYQTPQNQMSPYRSMPSPFRDFFGDEFDRFFGPQFKFESPQRRNQGPQTKVGMGSGVIVSDDGYIMTNNHVIADADDIEVTLHDNRTYKATVIGTDPSTDLALIQIKEKDLPRISFVNSDDVKVGEWVLAVGNPFSLNSTITAGIVSAKSRNINILKEQYAVENFIQTDAAINPGNSGGALVNLNGGLIGINTAISSPTGVYSGYGFAVPSNIVEKVMDDLLKYGVVQRGVLGVMIRTVDGNLAKEKDLDLHAGVYVDSLMEKSAARDAGVKMGDVIIEVNGASVKSSPELQGIIARHRPGERIDLKVHRGSKDLIIPVTLNNSDGNRSLNIKEDNEMLQVLGIDVEKLPSDKLRKLDIESGVKIAKIYPGKIRKYTQMREGFIVTKVDGERIKSKEQLLEILEKKKGGVMLEGVYEDIPGVYYYALGL